MVLHRFLRDVESRNILLQYEFHKKNSPRLAHQNLCQMTSWKKIVEQEEKPYCRWDRIPLFDDTTTSRFKQDKEEEEKEDPVPEEEKEFDISKAYYKEESISYEKVSFIFKDFRNGNFEVEPLLHPILKDLCEVSIEHIGLSSIPRFTTLHPSNKCYHFAMTHLKIVTHGASILKLVTFHEEEPNAKLRIEYWQTREGCFVWCGHDVKFVEKKFHYTLATIDFMIAIRYMSRPLVEIDFDIQKWNGWDCKERPDLGFVWTVWDTFLYNKSLNIHAEIFRMTVSKTDRDEKRLSLIRFVKPRLLEVIILNVWDDRHMGCRDKDEPFKFKEIYNTKQWKRAFCVDIRDKMIQKNFSAYPGFQQIQMTMKEEELMDLKEAFAENPSQYCEIQVIPQLDLERCLEVISDPKMNLEKFEGDKYRAPAKSSEDLGHHFLVMELKNYIFHTTMPVTQITFEIRVTKRQAEESPEKCLVVKK
ncbi:hypothetical protein B9Z55_013555 [Caenorhabditis nigoni]|uniref:DUF38 domain-containing protein n=1 Tax=Caenorhabditis nigoni TaxID=1611254 RepID=A0A2G5U2Q1_9PELO|nr:hypothetical protein B9Z55_013555 [Caenorhabditis nigoni]